MQKPTIPEAPVAPIAPVAEPAPIEQPVVDFAVEAPVAEPAIPVVEEPVYTAPKEPTPVTTIPGKDKLQNSFESYNDLYSFVKRIKK